MVIVPRGKAPFELAKKAALRRKNAASVRRACADLLVSIVFAILIVYQACCQRVV